MSDITEIAHQVSGWTGLGVKLPKELAAAIEVFETLKYTEVERGPVFDIETVTVENAEDKIRELADQLVLSEVTPGTLSTLQKAKNLALDAAARKVRGVGVHMIPEVIRLLTPEFDGHVKAYTEAVAKLPDNITSDTLIAAGAGAVTAFGEAQQEARNLHRIDSWSAQTANLYGIPVKQQEFVIRILQPESMPQLAKLDAAHAKGANTALQSINPVFYTAAREGIPFGINTARQAISLRTSLEMPQLQSR